MSTLIEENQLKIGLQELYVTSKRWIADLEVFNRDLSFLQKLVERGCSQLKKHEVNENLVDMKLNVSNLQSQSIEIDKKVMTYFGLLEPLLKHPEQNYDLSLIETHSLLEREISSLLQTFKSVKQRVFKLTSERIKAINSKNLK